MNTVSASRIELPKVPDEDRLWAALCARDARYDGRWFYGVRTTGVYCRPSCSARRPRRENVSFHASADAAEAAGFRPCKRCTPRDLSRDQRHAAAVAAACRHIAAAETPPDLDTLAAVAGMSRFHFHRVFKAATGLTPRAYAAATRKARMREELERQDSVTAAIYGAGFNSNGRFYAASADALGMTPRTFRAGGAGERIRYALGRCALGTVLVAATARGLCAISLGDDGAAMVDELEKRFHGAEIVAADGAFAAILAQVIAFLDAPGQGLALPLDVRGTAFQERVWQALSRIPPGKTASYAEIAAAIGQPRAVRAVARACAANALAVAIPCHRVVKQDGSLSGYRWGSARKRALLECEADR